MTIEQIKQVYAEEGSLKRTCLRLKCSKPTIMKYLRDVPKDRTPWKTYRDKPLPTYATEAYQEHVFEQMQAAILNKRVWVDVEQRKVPAGFIKSMYYEMPDMKVPVVPVYAILRDNTRVVLLHPISPQSGHS